jgi:putative hydrolase of the HAD superfamily
MVINAVLFDLDNTLIDFMRMKHAACEAAIDAMIDAGLKMNRKAALSKLFELYEKYGIEYQKIFQVFLRTVTSHVDYRIMAAGIVAYRKVKEGNMMPYPGVPETLAALKAKGMKLGIVSNAPKIQAWTRLAYMDMHKIFDFVVTAEDVGEEKPGKLPFKEALKELGLPAEQVIMVGDDPKRDMAPAKALGMRTVLTRTGVGYAMTVPLSGFAPTDRPDAELKKFDDLLAVVEKY